MTVSTQERVTAGAFALDAAKPGWENQIDLDRLDVSSPVNCVLGQLYGEYTNAPKSLRMGETELGFYANSVTKVDGMSLADYFDCMTSLSKEVHAEYEALTSAWKDLVTSRREETTAHQELIQQAPEVPTLSFDEVIGQFQRELDRVTLERTSHLILAAV